MSEIYFVDGYNLLHFASEWKDLARDDLEAAREALVDAIGKWCDASGGRAKIVFDGRGRRTEASELAEHLPHVEVLYSSRHLSADAIIERAVYEAPERDRVVVVSADRGILDLCRGMGAMSMRPEYFLESLNEATGKLSARIRQNEGLGSLGSIEEHLDKEQREKLEKFRRDL